MRRGRRRHAEAAREEQELARYEELPQGHHHERPPEKTIVREKTMARRPEGPPHPRKSGTWSTLKRTISEFIEDHGTVWAAALTYFGLLAIFPALLALVSLVGLFADPQEITETLTDVVRELGPASAVQALQGPIESVTADKGAAGILAIVGLLAALWSASGYIGGFTQASNVIWEVEEGRPFYLLRPLQMLVTLVQVLLLALVAVAVVVSGPVASAVGSALGIGSTAVTVWNWAKWPVMVLVVLVAIALLYYATPNARQRGFRSVLPGAVVAVVVWLLASVAFAVYVANFGAYNATYGTLGGLICFLVWYWISNVAVVLGTEFNAERERSRQIAEAVPGAERELQVDLRREPKLKKRSRTG
ncbi:MAG: YihY/virulence factor BrkB family protein [Actinomycetes bacterium]